MVDDRQQGRKPRRSARIAFAIGTAATIGANVAGAHPTLMGPRRRPMNAPATTTCLHFGQQVRVLGNRLTLHSRPTGDHCRDSGKPVPNGAAMEGTIWMSDSSGPSQPGCPGWCTTDHIAESEAEAERVRKTAELIGDMPPTEDVRVHAYEVGVAGAARVRVEQSANLTTGQTDPPSVSVFGAEDLTSPEDVSHLGALIVGAAHLIDPRFQP